MHKEIIAQLSSQGKIIGVGSGTTITSLMKFMSSNSIYLPSSFQTHKNLITQNLQVKNALDTTSLDFYFDGADYYNETGDVIKGRGGCLLQEKFLMEISKETYIFVQKHKLRTTFKNLLIPLDVLPIGVKILESKGARLKKCEGKFGPILTENGCFMMEIPFSMLKEVKDMACVVCDGYFEKLKFNYTIVEL